MTPLHFTLITFAASLGAGVLGSLLGLGGGIIIVPVLTLLLGIDIRYAIGASIVSVIATSSGAAAAYVRERIANLRLGMAMEMATSAGAVSGAYLAGLINTMYLYIIFGLVLIYSAFTMLRNRHEHTAGPAAPDRLADRLKLHSSYYDQAAGKEVSYRVTHTAWSMPIMYVAGVVSGLLGVGGGVLKVPTMDIAMHLPIKVSTATSNFMIGVTAAASAGVYFARGDIDPFVAAPVAAGVLLGATAGSFLMTRIHSRHIRIAFVIVLLWVSLEMLRKGWKGL